MRLNFNVPIEINCAPGFELSSCIRSYHRDWWLARDVKMIGSDIFICIQKEHVQI
jgi:hypothetical protein